MDLVNIETWGALQPRLEPVAPGVAAIQFVEVRHREPFCTSKLTFRYADYAASVHSVALRLTRAGYAPAYSNQGCRASDKLGEAVRSAPKSNQVLVDASSTAALFTRVNTLSLLQASKKGMHFAQHVRLV